MFAIILEAIAQMLARSPEPRHERFPLTTRLADGTIIVHGTIPGE